jgi:dienelactone hydrolase
MAHLKSLFVASTFLALTVLGISKALTAKTFNPAPPFKEVASYKTKISASNNLADIYFPNPKDLKTGKYSFPIVLLLQGALVDRSNYSNYASIVARYGFVVVVPNRERSLPSRSQALAPLTSDITEVLEYMTAENSNSASPVFTLVDAKKLALLGHSFGGAVGLSAIADLCLESLSFCKGSFKRPKELVAGAFFGANLRNEKNEFIPINNSGIPIALLQGNLDSRALPVRAEKTYNNIQTPPKVLITILGVNHFGITNTNNPVGAIPDSQNPTLAQNIAVETIARWSGLFLRASLLKDKGAFDYVYYTGDARDPNVAIVSNLHAP